VDHPGKEEKKMTTQHAQPPPGDNPIRFCGAGPGDPQLITVKGQRALAEADLILYAGSLVPEALLKWARPSATTLSSAGMHLEEIVATLAAAWRGGQRVVRLHTGDPSLFGALHEQIRHLEAQKIPYEVIPGVTAAFAAAASLGMEYTLPEISQTLILTRMAGRTPVPEQEALERLAAHQASMAIYLSLGQIEAVSAILSRAYGRRAPAIIVYKASHPEEKIVTTTCAELAAAAHEAQITRTALILAGKVLAVAPQGLASASRLYDRHFAHGYRPSARAEEE
jgi:precorrin-4/cobalt-precorrin-4 C11-methyltransferase